jgi:hypothetical protein
VPAEPDTGSVVAVCCMVWSLTLRLPRERKVLQMDSLVIPNREDFSLTPKKGLTESRKSSNRFAKIQPIFHR